MTQDMSDAADAIELLISSQARLSEAVKVLEPFVALAEAWDKNDPEMIDEMQVAALAMDFRGSVVRVTLGDFRAAKAFLATLGEENER